MFNILSDIWAHPGAVHAPVVPFDITDVSVDEIEVHIKELRSLGCDTLLITADEDCKVSEAVLDALFAAASYRHMLVFIHESIVTAYTGMTDTMLRACNPMSCSHILKISDSPVDSYGVGEELVSELNVRYKDGVLENAGSISPSDRAAAAENRKMYISLSAETDGIDLLECNTAEILVGAFEIFFERFREVSAGSLVGFKTDRINRYVSSDCIYWTYDMIERFHALGGTDIMLVSLLSDNQPKRPSRHYKEGLRIYKKALAELLNESFCNPLSEWCGKNSLSLTGEVPYEFISDMSSSFTLPIFSDEGFDSVKTDFDSIWFSIKCLADMARGEGFTGAGYKCNSMDADSLMKEVMLAASASCSLIFFPDGFVLRSHLNEIGVRREDMRQMFTYIKRLSSLGTSCGCMSDVAVLCDNGMIPYSGASKLTAIGIKFNFVSLKQLTERAYIHNGKVLIDKFAYSTVFVDPRIRMSPFDVKKLGELPVQGGKMYIGGLFGDYAKKHLKISDFDKECAGKVTKLETIKSGCEFLILLNRFDKAVDLNLKIDLGKRAYIFDPESGNKTAIVPNGTIDEPYKSIHIASYGICVIGMNSDEFSEKPQSVPLKVSEIIALKQGENTVDIPFSDEMKCYIYVDSFNGAFCDVILNGIEIKRILYPPYSADITDIVSVGENMLIVKADGDVHGACLHIFRLCDAVSGKTAYTVSAAALGCRVNQYETDALLQSFSKLGYAKVPFGTPADVTVINTCTVTSESDRKSRQMIRRAASVSPGSVVVVTGCYAETGRAKIEEIDGVKCIVGNASKSDIPSLAHAILTENKAPDIAVSNVSEAQFDNMTLTEPQRVRSYIKIEDGCNNKCSYCIIPKARGRVRSKAADVISEEGRALHAAGCLEVILTGIEAASYGSDFGRDRYYGESLASVIEEMGVIGFERIGMGSLDPTVMNSSFVERISKVPQVLPHFHLSVQSGSSSVLARMRRKYNADMLRDCIDRIRQAIPDVMLSADIIVGFPGESEDEFGETVEFIEKTKFLHLHIFPYSPREGTEAAEMECQLSNEEKSRRLHIIEKKQQEIKRSLLEEYVGIHKNTPVRVLAEQIKNGRVIGHSEHYVEIELDLLTSFEKTDELVGKVVCGYLTETDGQTCRGYIS